MHDYAWAETTLVALIIEGYFYGLYTAIFVIYHQALKKDTAKAKNTLFYPLCILYVLSSATFVIDIAAFVVVTEPLYLNTKTGGLLDSLALDLHLSWISTVIASLCDFISLTILIYRCWVVWVRRTRIIIFPSILAFAFLATSLASSGAASIAGGRKLSVAYWGHIIDVISLTLWLTVNAILTSLIVLRIVRVYREVKHTREDENLGVSGSRTKLRPVMLVIIKSGIALFSIQLCQVCILVIQVKAFLFVFTINRMLNVGISPTIILLWISMKLSCHDEKSLLEATCSIRFASLDRHSTIPETRSTSIVGLDRRDDVSTQQSDDIDIEDWIPLTPTQHIPMDRIGETVPTRIAVNI